LANLDAFLCSFVPLAGTYGGLPGFLRHEVLITLCGLAFATLFAFAIAAALMIK
jgi:hypothetical protein